MLRFSCLFLSFYAFSRLRHYHDIREMYLKFWRDGGFLNDQQLAQVYEAILQIFFYFKKEKFKVTQPAAHKDFLLSFVIKL